MYRKDLLMNNCGQLGFNNYEAETSADSKIAFILDNSERKIQYFTVDCTFQYQRTVLKLQK